MEKEIESKLIGIILTVFDLNKEAVFSRCRKRELVICRQTIHTIFMEKLKYSDTKAGQITGHDRCTAINSYKSINNILDVGFKPYADYIHEAKILCSNLPKPIKIKVKNYIFYKHSNLN